MPKYNVRMFYTVTYYKDEQFEAESEAAAEVMANELLWETDVKRDWQELDDVDFAVDIDEVTETTAA